MKLKIIALMGFAAGGLAHMQLIYPPPLGGQNNPYRTDAPNQYMQYPVSNCISQRARTTLRTYSMDAVDKRI